MFQICKETGSRLKTDRHKGYMFVKYATKHSEAILTTLYTREYILEKDLTNAVCVGVALHKIVT